MKELLINSTEENTFIYLIEEQKLVEYYIESFNEQNIDGNIYIGKVQNIIPGLEAAFINLGEKKNAFIHKKDVLPKEDETKKDYSPKAIPITKLIKPGSPILVEVKKDKMSTKGARVSTHLSFRGRFVVLMPNSPYVTLSSKILNDSNRKELKAFVSKNLPEGMGAIIRTNAENATKEEILKDIKRQKDKWENIKNIKIDKFPKKIYDSGGILKKVIIDLLDYNLDRIIVNSELLLEKVNDILDEIDGKIEVNLENRKIEELYNIKKEIEKIKNNKVWLKSGAFITIDNTEALTAIDVNTGKFTGKTELEETIYKVNEEAAIEIARQIRLRDIGGIVVIDFVDMHKKENIEKIINTLKNETRKDRSKVQIEEFTKLNLLELTRKHMYIK